MTHDLTKSLPRAAALAVAGICVLGAGQAAAQSFSANSAELNGGYGRYAGQENQPIDVSTRDENGNRVIVDGVIQDGSSTSTSSTSGAGSTYAGAGKGSTATAIGNNLQVITQGSYNTVIVNSTQINNGDVTANSASDDGDDSLNGELDLND